MSVIDSLSISDQYLHTHIDTLSMSDQYLHTHIDALSMSDQYLHTHIDTLSMSDQYLHTHINTQEGRLFDQLCAVVHHNCAHHMHNYIMSSLYTVDWIGL